VNEWHTIQTLHTNGLGVREIARQVGLARNTVRKYLESRGAPQRTAPNADRDSLKPFAEDVEECLAKHYIGNRILQELRAKGYTAPRRTFYRHLAQVKDQLAPRLAVARFETLPGEQAQFDWTSYTLQLGGAVSKVYIHSLILGYSRYQYFVPTLDCTQVSILGALEEGFRFFGGVPHVLLVDNPKALVTQPRPDLRFNRTFREFAGHYGFEPQACWPYRAQTKGKVERPFRILEEYFIKGNHFAGFSCLVLELQAFLAGSINARIHGTTRERPVDRFRREQAALIPLPERRFISTSQLWRKVSADCLVCYDYSRYSVPSDYAYKSVWIRPEKGVRLEIYAQDGKLIARHEIPRRRGETVMDDAHYQGLAREEGGLKLILARRFQKTFPHEQTFLDRLLGRYRFNATLQLRRILSLAEEYSHETFREALAQALAYNLCSYQFVKGILEARTKTLPAPQVTARTKVPGDLEPVNIRRDLAGYQTLLELESPAGGGHD